MSARIRVLVVDDATVVRSMLARLINTEPDMELAGSAADGKAGVEQAEALRPDVIVLDLEMPVMDGLEALGILRERLPDIPVIVFSALSLAGASITLEALAAGAADYSTKPSNTGSSAGAAEQVRTELLAKIRALGAPTPTADRLDRPGQPATPASTSTARSAARSTSTSTSAPTPSRPGTIVTRPSLSHPVEALVIGSSTGGPAALEAILPRLPGNLAVPVLLVQHMPPTFTTVLAERLDKLCPYPVHEAADGMKVEPGHGYLAAGGHHMRISRTREGVHLRLDQGPKVKSCRPSVDVMFETAAKVYGGRLVATMLTGMGDDGLDACRHLAELNAEIIAQDEESSVVWGMPGAVAKAGLATRCLPLTDIPKVLIDSAARRAPARTRAARVVTT